MPQIDRWVVKASLEIIAQRPSVEVCINLSGATLNHLDLLDEIEQRILWSGISPRRLSFEITETAAVTDMLATRQWMRRLKELGCRFALDDFGIGFSSFAYLQTLPADFVKIDGSFIRDIDTNPTSRALVKAIVSVAHALGKQTIAESVESLESVPILQQLGVEFAQGYALGRPGPLEEARSGE